MKNIAGKLYFGLMILLALPLIIIAIPLAVIANIIDVPFKPRRQKKLRHIIDTGWIPAGKYVYLSYEKDSNLESFIEGTVLPKYEKHIIVDVWNPKTRKWEQNWPDDENRIISIVQDIASDYDGGSIIVATVSKKTRFVEDKGWLDMFDAGEKNMYIGGQITPIETAQEKLMTMIDDTFREWGVKPAKDA